MKMKKQLIVLGVSGILLGAGLVGAQQSGGATTETPASESQSAPADADTTGAQRAAMLAHMLLRHPLDMGSTLSVTFYNGDPEADGSELQSLEFIYGEDSEAAFAEELEAAAAEAAYVTVTTSPQIETFNLEETGSAGPGGFGREGFGERGPGGTFGGGFGGGRH
jgi:hypothetical protein